MKAKDFISQKFASVGIQLTDADLLQIGVGEEKVTTENANEYQKKFIEAIPMMLLRPTSVSEGGTSMSKATRRDIEVFYSSECKRLGIKDILTKNPKVRFK